MFVVTTFEFRVIEYDEELPLIEAALKEFMKVLTAEKELVNEPKALTQLRSNVAF